jgi:1-phosphofructokinase
LGNDFYAKLCAIFHHNVKYIDIVVDCCGEALLKTLRYSPFLIKPNHTEICEIFGERVTTDKEHLFTLAEKLLMRGALNVIVSIGGEGAIMVDRIGNRHFCKAPEGKFISAVGAGDSLIAGFLAGFYKTGNYESALKKGVATGSATAFCEWLAEKEYL